MAKFSTHLYGAAAVGSAGALVVHSLGWATPGQAQLLFCFGVAGGLLPDIDSDSSAPVRGFFTLLGVGLAFLLSFSLVERLSLLELAMIWCGVFLLVRFGLSEIFARCTVHRGVWHSWLAAAFAALVVVNGVHHFFEMSALESWLFGLFTALGYLTHLCLDEITSVDVLNNRLKRSFGTALKPFSAVAPWSSLTMLAATLGLTLLAPTPLPLLEAAGRIGLPSDQLTRWRSGLTQIVRPDGTRISPEISRLIVV